MENGEFTTAFNEGDTSLESNISLRFPKENFLTFKKSDLMANIVKECEMSKETKNVFSRIYVELRTGIVDEIRGVECNKK